MNDAAFLSIEIDNAGAIRVRAHASDHDRAWLAVHWARELLAALADRPDALALLDDVTPAQTQAGARAFLDAVSARPIAV